MDVPFLAWAGVVAGLAVLLLVDLFVVDHKPHALRLREAGGWAVGYIALAVLFGLGLWALEGGAIAGQFFAGYLVEESLSVDNLFVFVLIMSTFAVPAVHQHRVLLLGIIGALVLRAGFIAGGLAVLDALHWVIYVFGAFLVLTGVRLAVRREAEPDLAQSRVLRVVQRVVPTTTSYDGGRLLTRLGGRRALTPLALALVTIATTDVMFAIDSIPAVFAVTRDPFLVFTSNAFALIGLRSLYFLLAGAVARLVYLRIGLAAVLVFVGVKMLIEGAVHVPVWLSLVIIVAILSVTVLASLRRTAQQPVDQAIDPVPADR